MKYLLFSLLLAASAPALAQSSAQPAPTAAPDAARPLLQVEAACGQCKLGLPGKACDLAVRLNGQAYFVDGTAIDSHGDAPAQDGFCNAVRQAEVQGTVVNNRFQATYFRLLPASAAAPAKP